MKYPKYPKYKDSNIEWIGEIPEHWDVTRARWLFREINERSTNGDETLLSVSEYYGVKPRKDVIASGDFLTNAASLEGYKKCQKNDLVMNIMLAWKGALGITDYDGIVSPSYNVFRPLIPKNVDYLHYLFRTKVYADIFRINSTGIIDSRLRLYPDSFAGVRVILPPVEEQVLISKFLQAQLKRLERLVLRHKTMIELLKEKRQAIITHAVTKGLDPNVPMKNSGVFWLGEIPEHWRAMAIKRLLQVPMTDGPHETPTLVEDGIPFVSAEAVNGGYLNFEHIRGYVSREEHERFSPKYKPKRDDVFIVKSGATTGTSAIVETDMEFNIWSPLAALRSGPSLLPRFLLMAIRSRKFQDAIATHWSYGTQQNIGMGVLENLPIPVPPIAEQKLIIDRIVKVEKILEETVIKLEKSINLLREYRSSLIFNAVTGQMDLRSSSAD